MPTLCRVFPCPDYINVGFLGRWGTHACPQCLPSDIVPIRSWTRTLRPPGIRHRHLPYHTIPNDQHKMSRYISSQHITYIIIAPRQSDIYRTVPFFFLWVFYHTIPSGSTVSSVLVVIYLPSVQVDRNPTWQLFTPAWHVPLWSDRALPLRFQVHMHFHVCLRLSWTSALLAGGITPTTTAGFSKGLPASLTEFTGRLVHF